MTTSLPPTLGIIAGGGEVPRQLIQACQRLERPFFVVCLEGQAGPDLAEGLPHAWLPLGAAARLKALCAERNIREIVMIGRVRRPSLMEIKPDWLALKVLTRIGMALLGDDALLRAIGRAMEEEGGLRVLGAHEVFADLLAPEGVLGAVAPDDSARQDIARADLIARTLGRLDVGQAVIVQQGITLGVEAAEGTDALIARAATLRREGPGGVLVKRPKPQQDNRYDLPTLGPDTVRNAAQAGLRGLAFEAGRSLLMDRARAVAEADAAGLFLIGLPAPAPESP